MSVLSAGRFIAYLPCLQNGGSGLIGNSGRRTASVCDKHAKETIRNIATDFTGFAFIIFYGKRAAKFLKMFRKVASEL